MAIYNSKTRIIDLSNKQLTEIPKEIFKCRNLRKLFLYNNKIKKIPSEIKNLKHLIVLDLSNNQIDAIYAPLGQLKKLRILMLNGNNIKKLPTQFTQLENLRILGLSNNKLREIPKELYELKNLKRLNLTKNQFGPITNGIEKFRPEVKLNFEYIIKTNMKLSNNDPKEGSMTFNSRYEKKMVEDKIIIFISYAQNDNKGQYKWLDDYVRPQLMQIETLTNKKVEIWDDSKIKGGKNILKEIENNLNKANCAILLFSHSYIISEFVRKEEIPPIINAAIKKGLILKALLLSPCAYKKLPFFKNIKLDNNDLNKPFLKLVQNEQNEIFEILSKMVYDIMEELHLETDENIYSTKN